MLAINENKYATNSKALAEIKKNPPIWLESLFKEQDNDDAISKLTGLRGLLWDNFLNGNAFCKDLNAFFTQVGSAIKNGELYISSFFEMTEFECGTSILLVKVVTLIVPDERMFVYEWQINDIFEDSIKEVVAEKRIFLDKIGR